MFTFYQKLLIIALSILLLSSCQLAPKQKPTAKIENISLNSLTEQNTQINLAIHLLERGKQVEAKKLIEEVLKTNSKHSTAKLLNKQLTLSAKVLFKTSRTVEYQIKAGDSLGKIAKKWLGNSLYFVSLAKLNKISQPLNLKPGIKIIIPVTTSSETAKKERQRSKANLALIRKYNTQKKFYKALEKANQLFIVKADNSKLIVLQKQILKALKQSTISLSEREKMLKKLTSLSLKSRNKLQKSTYNDFINKQSATLYLEESLLLFKDKSYIQSAEKLILAKKINKNYLQKNAQQSNNNLIEKQLLNKLHEQAVIFYRSHELQQAIIRWYLVLQIQPNNKLAKKYIERTQKLLRKLNQY